MSQAAFHEDYGNTRGFGLPLNTVHQGVVQKVTKENYNIYVLGDYPGMKRFVPAAPVDYSFCTFFKQCPGYITKPVGTDYQDCHNTSLPFLIKYSGAFVETLNMTASALRRSRPKPYCPVFLSTLSYIKLSLVSTVFLCFPEVVTTS